MGFVSLLLSTGSRKMWQGARGLSQAVEHKSGPNPIPSACCGRNQLLSSLSGKLTSYSQPDIALEPVVVSYCSPASLHLQQGCPPQEVNSGVTSAGASSAGTSPGHSVGASPRQSSAQQAAAGTGVQGARQVPDAQGQAMLRAAEGAPPRQQQQVSQLQLRTFTADLVPRRCKRVDGQARRLWKGCSADCR